ncbi:cytochrome c, class I [Candidatus Ruthia magnifica str. Cm (Calyptogena magnifica)]|uniref:Cytochrome c, class I n=1 Tax=Ruthia magnifica subsp. Calyptogena magnifica TaxID=413404 RepID=A1AVN2_RUTMC|nr:c-type cytochrome [Candidatus Ruthturnera calyptogenae]ABL01989.1 cytochrome c, class I [Candidatus Ruthia magnifica str. Cm (Calyptogena magnifica)]
MKRILLVVTVATFTMNFAQADGAADYAAGGCANCHGITGVSVIQIYPNLSGQNSAYTVKQLKDFQTGVRKDPTMNAMSKIVAGKEQSIADFLATQK